MNHLKIFAFSLSLLYCTPLLANDVQGVIQLFSEKEQKKDSHFNQGWSISSTLQISTSLKKQSLYWVTPEGQLLLSHENGLSLFSSSGRLLWRKDLQEEVHLYPHCKLSHDRIVGLSDKGTLYEVERSGEIKLLSRELSDVSVQRESFLTPLCFSGDRILIGILARPWQDYFYFLIDAQGKVVHDFFMKGSFMHPSEPLVIQGETLVQLMGDLVYFNLQGQELARIKLEGASGRRRLSTSFVERPERILLLKDGTIVAHGLRNWLWFIKNEKVVAEVFIPRRERLWPLSIGQNQVVLPFRNYGLKFYSSQGNLLRELLLREPYRETESHGKELNNGTRVIDFGDGALSFFTPQGDHLGSTQSISYIDKSRMSVLSDSMVAHFSAHETSPYRDQVFVYNSQARLLRVHFVENLQGLQNVLSIGSDTLVLIYEKGLAFLQKKTTSKVLKKE